MSRLEETVRASSPLPVVTAGATLGSAEGSYPFVDPSCPLFPASHEYLDSVLLAPVADPDQRVLAQYLAIAVSWHSLEGWRYLSQAANALLCGARQAAIHLAYYAELRAARSILAGSGICIRNEFHFGLDPSGEVLTFGALRSTGAVAVDCTIRAAVTSAIYRLCHRLWNTTDRSQDASQEKSIGTHLAASKALRAWARAAANGARVADALCGLRYRNIDWVTACQVAPMRDVIVANWLKDWSMDLSKLDSDKRRRNVASYGVSLSKSDLDPLRESEIRFVRSLNEACLSIGMGDVDALDIALLRDFVVKSAEVVARSEGRPWHGNQEDLRGVWLSLTTQLTRLGGIGEEEAEESVNSIRDAGSGASWDVIKAANNYNGDASGVLARAFLLLRLATALQLAQWQEMSLRSPLGVLNWPEELLRHYAVHTHLGTPGINRADLRDLEEDQAEVLEELDDWLDSGPFDSLATWQQKTALLQNLCRFERMFLVKAAS